MREIINSTKHQLEQLSEEGPYIHVHHLLHCFDELEKRIPLAAQTNHCAELEELQELLHFPEEVALRLADTEYKLFYQVPAFEYLRQVTADLNNTTNSSGGGGGIGSAASTSNPPTASAATSSTDVSDIDSTASRSSIVTLIQRFNEVSAWITQLIISQPTHDARRAVLSCVLRVALFSWNIGNFNGAMEIIAGLKSNRLKPFWLSITEKDTLPVLNFLHAALLSAEYERALSRALAMDECPVVPFFGAFLREMREILASTTETAVPNTTGKPPPKSSRSGVDQRLFISDYNGENHHFTQIGSGGIINSEKRYRAQAVLDHIFACHRHNRDRNKSSGQPVSLIEYLKASTPTEPRILAACPPRSTELDEEYEVDVDDYHPVQPLVHDHGVSFVCLSSELTKIDQHVMQIMHHGSTMVIWESQENQTPSTVKGIFLYLRLDRSSTVLTWVRPSWSALKSGHTNESDPFLQDFNLSYNPEDTLASGLLTKLALQSGGEQSSVNTIDDGFLDLTTIKEVQLGGRDPDKDAELAAVARRYGLNHEQGKECAFTILHGNGLSDNRLLYVICPPSECRVWYSGLSWLIRGISRLNSLCDKRLLWLREQYLQLYHEGGYCWGPLAADAIRSFGGRDWSLAGTKPGSNQSSEASGALRREVSMKIKKKQILSNQAFKVSKDKSLKSSFIEPATMCMESSYWRNPNHHRQSTPTSFGVDSQPDVSRHHSLGQLAYGSSSQPKFDRDRHGSTEHLWHGRHPRVGSILYDTQLDFVDFVTLFRSFSLLIRKDLRDLFEQLAISYRSMAVSSLGSRVNGVKSKSGDNGSRKITKFGLLTRNSPQELDGHGLSNQKKVFDAIAAASIFTNCAGIDTNNSQVITLSTFTKFLETRQMECRTENEVIDLINRHEPDPLLRSQHCLSFEGFARYLMDKDNFAFVPECATPNESEMKRPLSTYYIASSHNTYLTGHQLKGESSVELYSQVLLSGCRCVELDCWDGEDGYPMIYHGHTFTTKIPFVSVVDSIFKNAFVTSPYPIILSIENHCSLQQQTRMAHIFQRAFGDRLVTNFLFEADYSDEPCLPSPQQLRYRILIKNKKLTVEIPMPLSSASTSMRPIGSIRHSVPGRTSSIISNASSSSFNDDYSDDDYDDEDDDDNIDEKTMHNILTANESPRSYGSHSVSKTSSTKRTLPTDDKLRKKASQISKELSDLVIYVQAIKFRGLNTISPSSSVKQRPRACVSVSGNSIVTTGSSSASNISSSGFGSESDNTLYEGEVKQQRPNVNCPCYHCSSINENTAKKLCRKQPLALVAHTQTQLMRTYPAPMRIDSSNFNPVIFWSFGIQMTALNYQTEDTSLQLNNTLFETNGKCGYVSKPAVMWDKSHVMYKRFNPWDKQFDGIHSSQFVISVVSGQYVSQSNVNLSVYVEVEIIGIQGDCNKQRTKVVHKNALNPIWNETFCFRVMFQDLAFLRFSITDSTNNHLLAQRIIPLKCLKPGYRHLRLKNAQNKNLNMSTLFIYSRIEEESVENTENRDDTVQNESDMKESDTFIASSGTPICVKRKMFFLMVYGVIPEEPSTILKITQESTTQDVLLLCLQKANIPMEKINDYILVEEVARGWERKDQNLPATQRILDLHERPLQAQSQWKGEGKLILKRMGNDPSSRAWLTSIRSVANRAREARKSDGAPSNAWEENDTFLVCIYNVSPEIPYAILKVPLNACAQDVLAQALLKARRLEDPMNFVILEELEWGGTSHNIQQRALSDYENVYSAQSSWQTIGRFILQERANVTPTTLRKNRLTSTLRLATLDRISRGLNVARNVAGSSSKTPVQVALSDPTMSSKQSVLTAKPPKPTLTKPTTSASQLEKNSNSSISNLKKSREVHSEGEAASDDDFKESEILTAMTRLKKASIRKLKEWKS